MINGRACIYLPRDIHPLGVELWRSGYITHGPTFEHWLAYILLPDGYELICMYIDKTYQQWVAVVGSDALPAPIVEQKLPVLAVDFLPVGSRIRILTRKRSYG